MSLITKTEDLKNFLKECKEEGFIAVDTEFDRRNTYFPKLCLIQIATSKRAFAIDPFSKEVNLRPLRKILRSSKIIKVFHSSREDVETLKHNLKVIPQPIFDTQIAADVMGLGEGIGYSKLTEVMVGEVLDKDLQFSDWMRRPLSKRQIAYALDDVIYLRQIYNTFQTIMKKKKEFIDLIEQKQKKVLERQLEQAKPKNAWKRLASGRETREILKKIKKIAEWREKNAQKLNIPRQWVLTDSLLKKVARTPKKEVEHLPDIQELLESKQVDLKFVRQLKRLV